MSYQEIHEWYVICDECHTRLFVGDTTEEDVDNEAADQAEPASAKASGYQDRMRVEYRDLTARAGRLRDMLQRYADGTLDFEPTCPISLLSRQLDVMDEYALILRRRANIEHISLGEQRIDTATRDAR